MVAYELKKIRYLIFFIKQINLNPFKLSENQFFVEKMFSVDLYKKPLRCIIE